MQEGEEKGMGWREGKERGRDREEREEWGLGWEAGAPPNKNLPLGNSIV